MKAAKTNFLTKVFFSNHAYGPYSNLLSTMGELIIPQIDNSHIVRLSQICMSLFPRPR